MQLIIKFADNSETIILYDSIKLSKLISQMDLQDGDRIPITEIEKTIFEQVIKYCRHYSNIIPQLISNVKLINNNENYYSKVNSQWDIDFIKQFTFDETSKLTMAALYLDIESLVLLGSLHMSILLKDLSTNEIRNLLQVDNDFTNEEEVFNQTTIQYCCEDE